MQWLLGFSPTTGLLKNAAAKNLAILKKAVLNDCHL
jgi:hypothetical protein